PHGHGPARTRTRGAPAARARLRSARGVGLLHFRAGPLRGRLRLRLPRRRRPPPPLARRTRRRADRPLLRAVQRTSFRALTPTVTTMDDRIRHALRTLAVLALMATPLAASAQQAAQVSLGDTVATFSILAYDPATGEVGGAVQSRVFSVGNGVLWAEAGVGAVATQAIVDVSYGPQAIALLKQGVAPADVIRRVWEADPDPRPDNWTKQGRQFAVIDAKGNVAA